MTRFIAATLMIVGLAACSNDSTQISPTSTAAEPPASTAKLVDPARLNSALSGLVDSGALVGVSALVYEDDGEAYFGAFGLADREAERPIDRDTLVQIFSMTKPITGVALMTLYEEGKFQLDDPIAKYAPEFADLRVYAGQDSNGAAKYEAPRRAVTIRDFMRHTAGLTSSDGGETPVGALYREADPMNRENTLSEMAKRLGSVPLLYQPGTRWLYGPSVDVQAFLVERISGEPFDEFLQKRIFDPLGMNNTRYVVSEEDRARLAAVYRWNDDGTFTRIPDEEAFAFNSKQWPLTPGGWGLVSTLDDYMRFARMLLNEGELDGARIVSAESVRLMATDAMPPEVTDKSWLPTKGQVGFGIDFAVRIEPPANSEEASGVVGEFFWDGAANTLFWVDPANDIAAVLFTQYREFGKVPLHKAFRDAVYADDPAASALNKGEETS
jgi:CubicO group peptidase (beta-lactamase class C family)